MKIIFYIAGLSAGGAERVFSLLANYMIRHDVEVILITSSAIKDDFFIIDNKIQRISLQDSKQLYTSSYKIFFHQMKRLRNIIKEEKPDVVVSFMSLSNIFVLLSTIGLKVPVVISERNNPKLNTLKPIWKLLKEITFPFADKIVVQTKTVQNAYSFFIRRKMTVIKNPIDLEKLDNIGSAEYELERPSIIAVGRLHHLKGMDQLIEAFSLFHKTNKKWKLTILGEGEERSRLEQLIQKKEMNENIYLIGAFQNPYAIMKNADIYVLPSRTEGFPNALCEAMCLGLPSISFDCPMGPSEIIQPNVNGKLVENGNIKLLSMAMEELANNKLLCQKLSEEGIKLGDILDINVIGDEWLKLFKSLIKRRREK